MADDKRDRNDTPRVSIERIKLPGRIIPQRVGRFERVEITGHAVKQMRIREIPESLVLQALRRPTRRGLPTQPGRKRVRKNRGTYKAVDVVYEEKKDHLRVITVIDVNRKPKRKRKR